MKPQDFRIAIIDDDAFVISHLSKHLGEKIPEAEVVGISNPIAPLGFNVYIVDREFLKEATPIKVDFTEVGFKVESSIKFDQSACGGCSSSGNCG